MSAGTEAHEDTAQHVTWLDSYLPQGTMTPAAERPANPLNFSSVKAIFFRQRWLIASTMVIALAIGTAVTLISTPIYLATAKIRVAPTGSYVVEGQNIDQGVASNQVFSYLATQEQIMRSRTLAEAIATNLSDEICDELIGEDIDAARPANITDADWLKSKNSLVAEALVESLEIEIPGGSWVFNLGFRSSSPAVAAEIANIYAKAYVGGAAQSSIANAQYASTYLEKEIEDVRSKLEKAEILVNDYARNEGIIAAVDPSNEDNVVPVTLLTSNLVAINDRLNSARLARIEAEQRWQAFQNAPSMQLRQGQDNQTLQTLSVELTGKQAELIGLQQRYDDNYDKVVNLKAQVSLLQTQVAQIRADEKQAIFDEYAMARKQEAALEREFSAVSKAKIAEADKLVRLTLLQREAQALRDQLGVLLDRFNEVSSAASVDSGAISIVDLAVAPKAPDSPSFPRNIAIALALGLAMAAGLAILREILDDRLHGFDEVAEKLGLTLLGHTPLVAQDDLTSEDSDHFSALMEAYSSIRAAIDFSLPSNRNVIQFTSARASEGKSITAVIMAELFAKLGRKTLLVDCDLRHPSVATLLTLPERGLGVVDVVLGNSTLTDAIITGVRENLDVLPVFQTPTNPVELIASQEFAAFLQQCRENYAVVIVDSPPIIGIADAPILSRIADATVFLIEANKLPFDQARAAIQRIHLAGGTIIGAVVTKFRADEAGYGDIYKDAYYTSKANS